MHTDNDEGKVHLFSRFLFEQRTIRGAVGNPACKVKCTGWIVLKAYMSLSERDSSVIVANSSVPPKVNRDGMRSLAGRRSR
jgi:hypothetical protein